MYSLSSDPGVFLIFTTELINQCGGEYQEKLFPLFQGEAYQNPGIHQDCTWQCLQGHVMFWGPNLDPSMSLIPFCWDFEVSIIPEPPFPGPYSAQLAWLLP